MNKLSIKLILPFLVTAILSVAVAFSLRTEATGRVGAANVTYNAPAHNNLADFGNPNWGTDIRVNPAFQNKYTAAPNQSMAASPLNPDFVVASYDDIEADGYGSGYAASSDGGQSWKSSTFAGPWDTNVYPSGNTSVAFDGSGVVYYLSNGASNQQSGYFVLTSTNGIDWSDPNTVVLADNNENRSEAMIVADQRTSGPNAGNIYCFFLYTDNNQPYYHGVKMRFSQDHGRTWSADITVSQAQFVYYPMPRIAADGTIYVAYGELDDAYIGNSPYLYMNRSTDGGLTWSSDIAITGGPITKIGGPDFKFRELVLIAGSGCVQMRINHLPSIAISPTDPATIYASWNDGRWDSAQTECESNGKHGDIAFSRSTDSGATWSAPVRVNDDQMGNGVDQWQPAIAVSPNGSIGITWYDRRYSNSANPYFYDTAYSQSDNGGLSWSANVRVSDSSSDPTKALDDKGTSDIGYRHPFIYQANYALTGWTYAHTDINQADFYADHGMVGTGTGTPTPTSTAGVSATVTASSTSTPQTACTLQFTDVPVGSTFYPFVHCLACEGVMGGYACGGYAEPCDNQNDPYFRPANNITRGQLAKIVANSAEFTETVPPTQQTYTDVAANTPFWVYIERLSGRGAMGGYVCGTTPNEPCDAQNRPYFRPGNNVTRGQSAKIVANAAMIAAIVPATQQTYTDVVPNSAFWLYIERLAALNVVTGYACGGPGEPCDAQNRPYFRPGNNVTRGQASKIVANTFYPNCQVSSR